MGSNCVVSRSNCCRGSVALPDNEWAYRAVVWAGGGARGVAEAHSYVYRDRDGKGCAEKQDAKKQQGAKNRCAPSMLSDNLDTLVVEYCDGAWAVIGQKNTGGFGALRWDGNGWSEYERHGTQLPSDYACFDMDRLKKDGAPKGFREAVTECESSTTKSTAETPISGDCDASAFPDSRGDLAIVECDGRWAVGGPANTGAISAYEWKDGAWHQVEPDSHYETGSGGPCYSDEFIEERGMTAAGYSRMACNPEKLTN